MTISYDVQPGQIWLTYLRFIDKPTVGKVRPVVILGSSDDSTFYAAKVTSRPPRGDGYDVIIDNWANAGLRKPSAIRVDFVFGVPKQELLRAVPIGQLDNGTLANALQAIKALHSE